MIKIVLIIAFLIIFFLILALIGQLDDLCEMEKEIEILQNDLDREKSKVKEYGTRLLKAIEYIKNHIIATETEEVLLEILEGEDNE